MNPASIAFVLSLLWPQPRQVQPAPLTLIRLPVQVQAPAGLQLSAALLRRGVSTLFGPADLHARLGTAIRITLAPAALPHPEEYSLSADNAGILIRAHDSQGAFWGVHTLLTLLEQAKRDPRGFQAEIPTLHDWPDTPARAFMIQGAWTHNANDFKRTLDLLARLHVTYFALEFGPQVMLDFNPGMAEGARFSKAQAKAIIDYGRSLGLKPIAYLNLLGHLDRAYKEDPYTQHGGIDIRSDETYQKFVYPILTEMLEVYGPVEYFHCGMDESWDLFTWLSQGKYDVTSLLTRHIQRVDSFLKARGVKLVIWHDMLISPDLQTQLGAPIGPANGGPPQNTAAALAQIPKDVILDYWFYDPLAAYPALDYLKAQGFTVWASPWETPFSLVRYAQARSIPTMGTMWNGPPGCFSSPADSPVAAFYSQAAWNAAAAPPGANPEPQVAPAAQRATNAILWGRPTLTFPGRTALLLSSAGPRRVSWPAASTTINQSYGVPLDTAHPTVVPPIPEMSKPVAEDSGAASVLLPGNVKVTLDGVNTNRGVDQLILYTAPRTHTGTNQYGVEVSVSAAGVVLPAPVSAPGDRPIPTGGFVLSAHVGPKGDKGARLRSLSPGDRVAVLNAAGDWVGGAAPAILEVDLPGGQSLRPDAVDAPRTAGALVLYQPGYGGGHTGTNAFGVEAIVRAGKVVEVRDHAGDSAIPADGFVLSAHDGDNGPTAAALRTLKAGDPVHLTLERGGQRYDLAQALSDRRVNYPVASRCQSLFLAVRTGLSSSPDTLLGEWTVRYADGSTENIPVRYGRDALTVVGNALPQRIDDPNWLIEQPGLRCLVRQWDNPHPDEIVQSIAFEPAAPVLEIGADIVAVTAAAP